MTKLLILAYDFPPYVSVGGLRPFSWYKYLHRYGVYPIVVTRQWQNKLGNSLDYVSPGYSNSANVEEKPEGTTLRTPFNLNLANKILLKYGENRFRMIRKLITSYYEFLQFILPVGSKQEIFSAADEFLKNNKVDCIIATGDPFILFKYASKLSQKYSIPWIADYRDPWIEDTSMKNKIFKAWCAFFEKRFLKDVYKITTVSTFIQKQIEENIKNKEFEILLNGYDPEILEVTGAISQSNNTLSIAFTGTIQDWHPFESFLKICNEIISENSNFKIELHCFGINKETKIRELLKGKYQLFEQSVYFHPKMSNLDFAKSVAEHNACLLFNSYSVLGTKIFDSLAVKRKIILCYENDAEAAALKAKYFNFKEIESESNSLQADLVRATNSGVVVRNSSHLKSVLSDLNDELKRSGFIACPSVGIESYSRIKQVERLAKIVKEVSRKSN